MASDSAITQTDPNVSLSLQSLIDERLVLPHSPKPDTQGLSSLTGQVSSRRRGHGLEFEDLRAYTSGDDVRHIDWKVSARHNQLYTRIFREEKEQKVTLTLDFTSPMFTGSTELKAVQAGKIAANVAWHIVSHGGRCGLLIQTDNNFHAVQPGLGDKAALAICAEISKQFDLAKHRAHALSDLPFEANRFNIDLFNQLRVSGRSTGAIIVIVGLNNIDTALLPMLKEIRYAKELVVLNIEDPLEYAALPTGVFRYKSVGKNASIALNKKQINNLQLALDEQHERFVAAFSHAQVPLINSRIGITDTKAALVELGFLA